MKLWLFTDQVIHKLCLSCLRITWSIISSKLTYSDINGGNRGQWRLPRRSTLTTLPRRWFVAPLHGNKKNKNQTQAPLHGNRFVAEEEEESNEEDREGSGRETGPRGHQQNTKMALRKNQTLWGRRRIKGCARKKEKKLQQRERVTGERESSIFF